MPSVVCDFSFGSRIKISQGLKERASNFGTTHTPPVMGKHKRQQ